MPPNTTNFLLPFTPKTHLEKRKQRIDKSHVQGLSWCHPRERCSDLVSICRPPPNAPRSGSSLPPACRVRVTIHYQITISLHRTPPSCIQFPNPKAALIAHSRSSIRISHWLFISFLRLSKKRNVPFSC
jgi:hypothetical protein